MAKTDIGRRLYTKNVVYWNMTLCTLTDIYVGLHNITFQKIRSWKL